jgi:hypothetical protein
MLKFMNRTSTKLAVAVYLGVTFGAQDAFAGSNFNTIAGNIINSISNLPGLLTGLSYLLGTILGVLGILKIKDHVENPGNTPLQQGAVRLAAGGALFAMPIVFEAMLETIGSSGAAPVTPTISDVTFN